MLFIQFITYVASGFDKEMPVERSEIMSIIDKESRPVKTKSKKRKWREIEAIQDQYKLERELYDMDMNLEYELNEMMR
ncbi:MAG: hypothetical protein ACI9O6_000884 [Glaciecola sp.]|jgi:hypothetical protein